MFSLLHFQFDFADLLDLVVRSCWFSYPLATFTKSTALILVFVGAIEQGTHDCRKLYRLWVDYEFAIVNIILKYKNANEQNDRLNTILQLAHWRLLFV